MEEKDKDNNSIEKEPVYRPSREGLNYIADKLPEKLGGSVVKIKKKKKDTAWENAGTGKSKY